MNEELDKLTRDELIDHMCIVAGTIINDAIIKKFDQMTAFYVEYQKQKNSGNTNQVNKMQMTMVTNFGRIIKDTLNLPESIESIRDDIENFRDLTDKLKEIVEKYENKTERNYQ